MQLDGKNKKRLSIYLNEQDLYILHTWCCRIFSSCADLRTGSVRLPNSPGQSTAISRCCGPPLCSSSPPPPPLPPPPPPPPPSPDTWPFRWDVVIPHTRQESKVGVCGYVWILALLRYVSLYLVSLGRKVTKQDAHGSFTCIESRETMSLIHPDRAFFIYK